MSYITYLGENKASEFSQQIFNTSLDMLPHRLEVLKSEKQRNRHEIRQIFIENIQDYLESHEMTTQLKNEMTNLGTSSKSICKKIKNAIGAIKEIKEKSEERESINKKIELYKSFNKQSLMGMFEIEEKIKLCVRFELFQEAFELYMWYFNLLQVRKDKPYEVLKYLRKKLDALKLNIFEYMLLNLKKVKFNTISSILKQMVVSGEYNYDTLVPTLFSLFFYFAVKHKVDKVSFQKSSVADNTPLILANYPKSFDKVIRLLNEIFGDEAAVILKESNMMLLSKEFYKFEKILKFVLQGSDETLVLRLGTEMVRMAPRCFINFKGMTEAQIEKWYQTKNSKLRRKIEMLFRISRFQNSFEKLLAVDVDSIINQIKQNEGDKSRKVIAYEAVSAILKEKRGAEYIHILCNNFQAFYTFHAIYHNENAIELAEADYNKLKGEMLNMLERYLDETGGRLAEKRQEYLDRFNRLEGFLHENLIVCVS